MVANPALSGVYSGFIIHCQVNSGFFYSSAEQRERLVRAERAVTDERVQKIIDLKRQVRVPTRRAPCPRGCSKTAHSQCSWNT